MSYFKRDYRRQDGTGFRCEFDASDPDLVDASLADHLDVEPQGVTLHGDTLRTYRLALAATGRVHGTFHGGTVAAGMAAIVTTMNRVNGVYERDLAVRMDAGRQQRPAIVYTNAGTDPYTNNERQRDARRRTRRTSTNVIGIANYDIGHVFSTGGGGVAGLGVVCARATRRAA